MKINWLYNPFINIAGAKSLMIGLVVLACSAILGSVNRVHFDGVIDIHAGLPAPMPFFLIEVAVSWVIFSMFLYLTAVLLSKSRVRLVDIFGTQALAKYPYLLISLLSFLPFLQIEVKEVFQFTAPILAFALISLVITVWTVILMYNAYSVSANLTGTKAVVSFSVVLVMAEIAVKLLLMKTYPWLILI